MSATTPSPSRDLARIVLSVLSIFLLIAGGLWVLQPFLGALLWATMIVISTWPLLLWLQGRLGGRRGAAVAVMTVALLLVLFVPLTLGLSALVGESDRIRELAERLPTLRLPPPPDWVSGLPVVGPRAAERWSALAALSSEELSARLAPHLGAAVGWLAARLGSFGGMVLHFLLTVIVAAILFARGEKAAETVRRFFRRLSEDRGDVIVTLAGKSIRAVALGIVVTALVQTALAGIGLFAVGVPFAGLVTGVVLVLCIAQVGPLLPLLPAVIWLYASDSPVRGTILLVVMILAQAIDNVLRPVLIKRGADLSLLLIFPGVIGGLLAFGLIGLFVGPVILAVTADLLENWMETGPAAAEEGRPGA